MPSGIKINTKTTKNIIKMYNDGVGTMELTKLFGLSRCGIQILLKRNKIKLRKTSPYKNKYNIHYFDKFTKENCYWAGFILADGCIRSDRDTVSIHLNEIDREHLEKFAKAINYTGKILHDIHTNACTININGKWFPQALKKNFGIRSKKSLTVKFPKKVPPKYWSHLIRGIFDGDGSITKVLLPTSFTQSFSLSGTRAVLEKISKIFYKLGVRLQSKNKYKPVREHGNITIMSYVGEKNTKIIFDILYNDCNLDFCLLRKYERYINYFGIKIPNENFY